MMNNPQTMRESLGIDFLIKRLDTDLSSYEMGIIEIEELAMSLTFGAKFLASSAANLNLSIEATEH